VISKQGWGYKGKKSGETTEKSFSRLLAAETVGGRNNPSVAVNKNRGRWTDGIEPT